MTRKFNDFTRAQAPRMLRKFRRQLQAMRARRDGSKESRDGVRRAAELELALVESQCERLGMRLRRRG